MPGRFISASGRNDDTPMPALLITASIRPKRCAAVGDNALARLDVGEVGDERIDVARRGAEPREAGGIAIDRRDVVACGDQRAGDRRPDAAGRAGDEHNTRIHCH